MIISKIALCAVSGALAIVVPILPDRAPEPSPAIHSAQLLPQPPTGDINRLADAFPP